MTMFSFHSDKCALPCLLSSPWDVPSSNYSKPWDFVDDRLLILQGCKDWQACHQDMEDGQVTLTGILQRSHVFASGKHKSLMKGGVQKWGGYVLFFGKVKIITSWQKTRLNNQEAMVSGLSTYTVPCNLPKILNGNQKERLNPWLGLSIWYGNSCLFPHCLLCHFTVRDTPLSINTWWYNS